MKIVCISDTHGKHHQICDVPVGDILIHAGDFTYFGKSKRQLDFFLDWFTSLPHEHKIFIAGNHEMIVESNSIANLPISKELQNNGCYYLQNSSISINGLKIYGAPQQLTFGNMAFNIDTEDELKSIFAKIEDDTDILVTHSPPFGILDQIPTRFGNHSAGSQALNNRINQLCKLKACIFGHIHEDPGLVSRDEIIFVNAAQTDSNYHIVNKPVVIQL